MTGSRQYGPFLEFVRRVTRPLRLRIYNFQLALSRNILRKIDHLQFEIMVVSLGGVGTTILIRHISRFSTVNRSDDVDGHKHRPFPNQKCLQEVRVLFIYDDPDIIYKSLARRSYVNRQGAKLGSLATVIAPPKLKPYFLKRAIRAQIRRWRAYAKTAPSDKVMVVAYDEIWNRVPEIARFLGVSDPAFLRDFPPRRDRQS